MPPLLRPRRGLGDGGLRFLDLLHNGRVGRGDGVIDAHPELDALSGREARQEHCGPPRVAQGHAYPQRPQGGLPRRLDRGPLARALRRAPGSARGYRRTDVGICAVPAPVPAPVPARSANRGRIGEGGLRRHCARVARKRRRRSVLHRFHLIGPSIRRSRVRESLVNTIRGAPPKPLTPEESRPAAAARATA